MDPPPWPVEGGGGGCSPWKLRTKKPPLEKSLWKPSSTWRVELRAVSRAVFPLKTPSWAALWSGPSLRGERQPLEGGPGAPRSLPAPLSGGRCCGHAWRRPLTPLHPAGLPGEWERRGPHSRTRNARYHPPSKAPTFSPKPNGVSVILGEVYGGLATELI